MVREKRSKEKMEELLRRFESGSLSQKEFYEREGISKSTFDYWRRKLRHKSSEGRPVFEQILPTAGRSNAPIRLSFSKGVVLELPADYPPKDLLKIIRGILC